MLVVSLLMMGVATFAIGLLPTYASIGIAAPMLLLVCRLLQGFAVGGEWGGAVLMAAEHGDDDAARLLVLVAAGRRGAGQPVRDRRAVGAGRRPERRGVPRWGWRIPFLLSAVLVVIGLWVRLSIEESPVFKEAHAEIEAKETRAPADHRGDQASTRARSSIAMGMRMAENISYYIFTVISITYLTTYVGTADKDADPQGAADRRGDAVRRRSRSSAPSPTGSDAVRSTSPAPSASASGRWCSST